MNLEKIIDRIAIDLNEYYRTNFTWSLNYRVGFILFLFEYYSHNKQESIRNQIIEELEQCITFFNGSDNDTSLFEGIAGLGWIIQYLINNQFLSSDHAKMLHRIDYFVEKSIASDKLKNNYDLLYGLIGKGIYFLERSDKKCLQKISSALINLASRNDLHVWWSTANHEQVNMGLAHGMPSIIVFLTRIYQKEISKDAILICLKGATVWLLEQRLHNQISQYPSVSNDKKASRLAWCFGDLGIAIALHCANNILYDKILEQEVFSLLEKSSKRKIDSSGVYQTKSRLDLAFCHGTLGISHIYQNFYLKYKTPFLLAASKYWENISLNNLQPNQYFLGVKKPYHGDDNTLQWGYDPGIVEGLSGIGLVLLSKICPSKPTGWDKIFLTNI